MRISALLLLALSAQALLAQSGASVDGRVRNRASGAAVVDANVTFFARDELTQSTIRYQAVTDASGAFRFADVGPGRYRVMIEKSGFAMFPKDAVQVEPRGAPIAVEYQMAFGITPRAKLSGRLLDGKGRPAARAQITMIRGPDLTFATETDADGQFVFAQVDEGAYTLMAAPEMRTPESAVGAVRTEEVATYFPSTIDAREARRIVVTGNSRVDGFQLQTAPVFRVRGAVMDNSGRPAARASVRLMPVREQPAHVVFSFDSYFVATGEGVGFGPEVAHTLTGEDGSFEFAAVPHGDWRVVADAASVLDPQFGLKEAPSGSTGVAVVAGDVQGVRVFIQDSGTLNGSAEWAIWCVSARLSCGRKPAEDAVVPIWIRPADGRRNVLRAAVAGPDGAFQIDGVPSGESFVQQLPPLLKGALISAAFQSSLLGTRNLSREAVDLARGDPLKITFGVSFTEGGPVILNTDNPVDRSNAGLDPSTAVTGSVHGIVENGAGAAVVLALDDDTQGVRGALVFCQPDGAFDAIGLRSGNYRVAAFRGADLETLRDPEFFARVLTSEKKVSVSLGETASVQLGPPVPWAE